MPDTETTFEELEERIAKTIHVLQSVKRESMEGREEAEVLVKGAFWGEKRFKAVDYVEAFAVPNFYFHVSIAYAILRAQGVPLGKWDFLGDFSGIER